MRQMIRYVLNRGTHRDADLRPTKGAADGRSMVSLGLGLRAAEAR
jgi:hypothetical protein